MVVTESLVYLFGPAIDVPSQFLGWNRHFCPWLSDKHASSSGSECFLYCRLDVRYVVQDIAEYRPIESAAWERKLLGKSHFHIEAPTLGVLHVVRATIDTAGLDVYVPAKNEKIATATSDVEHGVRVQVAETLEEVLQGPRVGCGGHTHPL